MERPSRAPIWLPQGARVSPQQPLAGPLREQLRNERLRGLPYLRNLDPQLALTGLQVTRAKSVALPRRSLGPAFVADPTWILGAAVSWIRGSCQRILSGTVRRGLFLLGSGPRGRRLLLIAWQVQQSHSYAQAVLRCPSACMQIRGGFDG
jgi:hypothetical protein